jgi:uncharacterized protein (TIGR03435 family)
MRRNPATFIPIALACLVLQGQTSNPTFDAASIRPATPLGPMGTRSDRNGGPGTTDPGIYTCKNCPVYWVLSEAYKLQDFEFSGPDWIKSTRFDFMAKVPAGATKETFQLMLQNLLAERFKLAAHREKKTLPAYELTVGRNGEKFQQAPPDAPQQDGPMGKMKADRDGFPILAAGTTMAVIPGHARIRSDNQPIEWFADMLSGQLDSPVIDATGLKAKYFFMVSWAWEQGTADTRNAYLSALIDAVQQQLGLKLQQKKAPVDVLVVDHMEKTPTEN